MACLSVVSARPLNDMAQQDSTSFLCWIWNAVLMYHVALKRKIISSVQSLSNFDLFTSLVSRAGAFASFTFQCLEMSAVSLTATKSQLREDYLFICGHIELRTPLHVTCRKKSISEVTYR